MNVGRSPVRISLVKQPGRRYRRGEVIGVTGLLGAGQNELAECIFGTRPVRAGTTKVAGRTIRPGNPRRAIARGIGLIPEDRKTQGLVLDMSAMKNITLASIPRFARFNVLRGKAETKHAQHYVDELRIKCSSVHQPVRTMSGGNQQKVLLARWLTRNSQVLVLAEPTRGVDVAAKEEIFRLIRDHQRRRRPPGGGAAGGGATPPPPGAPPARSRRRSSISATGRAARKSGRPTWPGRGATCLRRSCCPNG
jgi:ABC-type sugar transport system ATPase subunit